ncbi:MAG TPA: bifunctional helix-turn-helix transcriptional regulator/GNAT family N-acetyltransferase [Iamia sp.]|jgi:DNA-binding MarR family transcriptional regulator/N-acetylglutamate synthase-like GNAT family acetyltransferase|nr:bifunctional helix-turn-helix transcriptional regulator/GNAT family N-acetyltransferase [Iamia sp.]
MPGTVTPTEVEALRAFNRTWTATAGLLQAGLLDSPYTLTEARVLFELAQVGMVDVADLRRALALDSGYLSRIVQRFRADGLVATEPSPDDGRRQVARLTARGREAFADLDRRSVAQVDDLLAPLAPARRREVRAAMETLTAAFAPGGAEAGDEVRLRDPEPGDLGWVVGAHGALYAEEHGWDLTFEALVARIVADHVDDHDPERDRMWIAERAGRPVGCIACVHGDDADTAKLRILLVDPAARGLGVGARLVEECIAFARTTSARRMVLFTVDALHSARRIYEAAGFTLVDSAPSAGWGVPVVEQTWSLDL